MDEASKTQISATHGRPGFAIKIAGPRVGQARLSANDLATIILRSQQVLKRIGQVLYGESSIGKGRKKKEIEELCELFIVGWKPGSAVAEVELAEPPPQMNFFGYVGEESLKAFLNGMERIYVHSPDTAEPMPTGFDLGVLQTCDFLGRVLERGIDTVRFEPIRVQGVSAVTFNRPLREKIRTLLDKPLDQRQVGKVGRLEMLDGHRGLEGRLWEPDGTRWLCIFKPEHEEVLRNVWMRTVKVVGEALVKPNGQRTLDVASLVIVEEGIEESGLGEKVEYLPFWASLSLDELADLQGVQPATDLDSIGALWPSDDDPDRMLAYLLEERSSRRRIAREDDAQ